MVLEVIVDISTAEIDRPFDYEGEDVPLGSRVAVSFAGRNAVGFAIGKKLSSDFPELKRAKYLDTPISEEQLALMNAMREKYNLRHIDVLRLFVPSKLREERDPARSPRISSEERRGVSLCAVRKVRRGRGERAQRKGAGLGEFRA